MTRWNAADGDRNAFSATGEDSLSLSGRPTEPGPSGKDDRLAAERPQPERTVIQPLLRMADARNAIRHVFIRDLLLRCRIGVHRHEEVRQQTVRLNIDLAVREEGPLEDDLANVVCYQRIADEVRALVSRRHIRLVETLADEVAGLCLRDPRVRTVRVRVEKLEALAGAASVGVEIERTA